MSDPIADMLTTIMNAQAAGKVSVSISFSKLKLQLAKILLENGFLEKIDIEGRKIKKMIKIQLRYDENKKPRISGLKKISKPGQRIYKKFHEIKHTKSGYGITIISTSKGLMVNKDARRQRLGGEIICEIW